MSGKKNFYKPKLPKVSTYMVARFRTEKLAQCLLLSSFLLLNMKRLVILKQQQKKTLIT